VKKISILSVALLSIIALPVLAKTIETNEIQIVINQEAPTNVFAANIGATITDDIMTTLPAGTTIIQNGLIYPKGTVSLNQQSFTVDKNGNPLTQLNSIGTWQSTTFELVEFDPNNPPAIGTATAIVTSVFEFNPVTNPNTPNEVITIGKEELVNTPANGVQLSVIPMVVLGGIGKNTDAEGTATAKIYEAPDGQSQLMIVKFNKKIKLNVPG
jgi:hypothetical protein